MSETFPQYAREQNRRNLSRDYRATETRLMHPPGLIDVLPDENDVREAVCEYVRSNGTVGRPELVREVANALGYEPLSKDVGAALTRAVKWMVHEGDLIEEKGRLRLASTV